MRFRLHTLLIVLVLAPPTLAVAWPYAAPYLMPHAPHPEVQWTDACCGPREVGSLPVKSSNDTDD